MTAGRRPSALRCCRDLGAGSRHRSISSAKLSAPPSRALKGATAAFREIDRPQRVGHGPSLHHDERRLDDRHRPFMSDGEPRAIEPPLARLVSMPADPAQPFAPLQSGHSDTPLAGSVLDWSAAEEDAYTLKQRSADASSLMVSASRPHKESTCTPDALCRLGAIQMPQGLAAAAKSCLVLIVDRNGPIVSVWRASRTIRCVAKPRKGACRSFASAPCARRGSRRQSAMLAAASTVTAF